MRTAASVPTGVQEENNDILSENAIAMEFAIVALKFDT